MSLTKHENLINSDPKPLSIEEFEALPDGTIFLLKEGSLSEYEESYSFYHRMYDDPWSSDNGFRIIDSW